MTIRGINKVILIGHLGDKPIVRYSPDGSCFATFSLATNESWQDKQTGEQREKTEWHRIFVTGKLAEIAGQYLDKGRQIYVEGQLRTRKWLDERIDILPILKGEEAEYHQKLHRERSLENYREKLREVRANNWII